MRVCLDARKLWDSGIGTYIRGLLDGFVDISADIRWDFISSKSEHADKLKNISGSWHTCNAKNYSLNELVRISSLVNKTRADLFHAPHYVIPLGLKLPTVVTVHDVIHLKFPQYFSPIQRAYARWMLKRVGAFASAVLTVSEHTKNDLINDLGFSPHKITVAYPGVGKRFFQHATVDALKRFREKYCLPIDFLLYVGNLKPHKNVDGLLHAWAQLKDSLRPPLIIVGSGDKQIAILKRQAAVLGHSGEVLLLSNFPDEDIIPLYHSAFAYVQASWYEGFGSPPMEAMASGLPVAVSNRGSLPEIVGDAALIFDPVDSEEMTTTLEKLITDQTLRADLITKGLARAANFSWEHTALLTYEVYQTVLEVR